MILKTVALITGKTAVQLMKVGAWGTAQQYTNTQFRENANHLIGEVERGTQHAGVKLKLIKND